jgi:hypothetical protein
VVIGRLGTLMFGHGRCFSRLFSTTAFAAVGVPGFPKRNGRFLKKSRSVRPHFPLNLVTDEKSGLFQPQFKEFLPCVLFVFCLPPLS